MSVSRSFSCFVVGCVAFVVVGHGRVSGDLRSGGDASREIARVRGHLLGAEAMLRSRDVSTLSAAQRAARERRVAELRAYRDRGVFPHNHRSASRTPVFIDEHGTRCAMAHLIERSGATGLAARIARTRNLARIRDLAADPQLGAWLDRNGLTLAEAARIQPMYDPRDEAPSTTPVWAASAFGAGVGLAGVGLNASIASTQGARNGRGLVGVGCGLLAAGLGGAALTEPGSVRVLGAFDIAVGIASFGLGLRQLNARTAKPPQLASHEIVPAAWCDREMRRVGVIVRF